MTDKTDKADTFGASKVPPKPDCCDCCQSTVAALTRYTPTPFINRWLEESQPQWFCEFCATTMASNAAVYPEQYRGQADTLKAICFIGNALMDALRTIDHNNRIDAQNAEFAHLGLSSRATRREMP
jgi:hypothetical protein